MKLRWLPALLILAVIALTVRLGFWQRDRAHQKEALEANVLRYEHATPFVAGSAPVVLKAVEFHRVRASGRFLPDQAVFLDNRPYRDQPGFYVVMPMRLADGGTVLVNRGWLPRNIADRTAIAPFTTPGGEVEHRGHRARRCLARLRTRQRRFGRASADSPEPGGGRVCARNRAAAAALRDPADQRRRRRSRARLAATDAGRRPQLRLHGAVVGDGRRRCRFRALRGTPRGQETVA